MTTYLLDTHVSLWVFAGDKRAQPEIFAERFTGGSFVFHQTSTWEIQIKYQLGKLSLPEKPKDYLPRLVSQSGMNYRTIEDNAVYALSKLPEIHRDPFDRLLLAHALVNGWTIVSADKQFDCYPVQVERL